MPLPKKTVAAIRAFDKRRRQETRCFRCKTPSTIGSLMRPLFRDVLNRPVDPTSQFLPEWDSAVGEATADRTTPLRIDSRGTLHVAVTSSALRAELSGYRKDEIREFLNAHGSVSVRDIKFTLH